tara:strand:- start:1216 stop:1515 length:300 start_codon:yes stop_codon:yes gene_type:complete
MINITFFWDAWAIFEGGDIFRMIQREDYSAATWQDCCDQCLSSFDWDDSELVKGFEEKVIETKRQLKEISIHENGEEIEAPIEIYEYFKNSIIELEKKN